MNMGLSNIVILGNVILLKEVSHQRWTIQVKVEPFIQGNLWSCFSTSINVIPEVDDIQNKGLSNNVILDDVILLQEVSHQRWTIHVKIKAIQMTKLLIRLL